MKTKPYVKLSKPSIKLLSIIARFDGSYGGRKNSYYIFYFDNIVNYKQARRRINLIHFRGK